ncbi:hypothetical protein [uncultured Bacteroides sp.]|uniref:hypothetical protein n=1 Tax=uncultured Bacteroides sp. TaxID=162156 RepID=UPI0026341573|nr:hypothetical protein [uncultured Bacteroides sp.]
MKNVVILLFCSLGLASTAKGQTEQASIIRTDSITSFQEPVPVSSDSTLSEPLVAPIPQSGYIHPFGMYGITPFDYGYATWELHKGLNASIGLNITYSPSKYAPSGVGFGQDAAFMYAAPISNRLSVAFGVYASNLNWGFIDYRNVGVAAVAAYRLTDRISIYAYGNKSLTRDLPPYAYPIPNFCGDRFGGMVNFKLGETGSISIGVEGRKNDYPWWY